MIPTHRISKVGERQFVIEMQDARCAFLPDDWWERLGLDKATWKHRDDDERTRHIDQFQNISSTAPATEL